MVRSFRREHGLENDRVNGLALDAQGTLWVSTVGGLFRMDHADRGAKFVRVSPTGTDENEAFFRFAVGRNGRVVAGGKQGTGVLETGASGGATVRATGCRATQ